MKKLYALISLVCLLSLFSCNKDADELERLIPQSSDWVAKISTKQIMTGSGFLAEGKEDITIPQELKNAISKNETFAKKVILSLPESGIDFNSDTYSFSSSEFFDVFAFISYISDKGKTEKWISNLSDGIGVKHNNDIDYIFSDGTVYVIKDDILLIGVSNNATEQSVIDKVQKLFGKNFQSIADNNKIQESLQKDCDIAMYCSMSGVKKNKSFKHYLGQYKFIDFIVGDNGAMTVSINFGKEMTSDIEFIDNNSIQLLYGSVFGNPSSDVADIIPDVMDAVVFASIKGENLMKFSGISDLLSSASNFPYLRDIDLKSLVRTIDGPVVIGTKKDDNFIDEYDYVIAIKSTDPETFISNAIKTAQKYGLRPQKNGNSYFLDYFNQRISMGTHKNNYVCVTIFDRQFNHNAVKTNPTVKSLMSKSKAGTHIRLSDGDSDIFDFSMGYTSATKITCNLKSLSSNSSNILIDLISAACNFEKKSQYLDDSDANDDFGDFEPIDGMSSF